MPYGTMETGQALNHSLTTCPVCFDALFDVNCSPINQKKPRALHCLHTMCEECLHSLALQTHYREIRCPTCRYVTPLDRDVDSLPINYYAQNLHEAITREAAQEKTVTEFTTCTNCSFGGKTLYAVVKCRECELNLCEACQNRHNQFSMLSGHTLHIIDNNRCLTHSKNIEYVCKTCQQELCPACLMTGNHHSHPDRVVSCSQVREEAHTLSQSLQVRLEQLSGDVQKAQCMEHKLLDIQRHLQEWSDNLHNQIRNFVEETIGSLQAMLLATDYQRLLQRQDSLQMETVHYNGILQQQGHGTLLTRLQWMQDVKEEISRSMQVQWEPPEDIPFLTIGKKEVPWPTISTRKSSMEDIAWKKWRTSKRDSNICVSSLVSTGETPKKIKLQLG